MPRWIGGKENSLGSTAEFMRNLVGAGTNPLEGVAFGMPLLECFAEAGALLTMATTHHSELKTLKYREFQVVFVGRSNAINIAERLGLPNVVVGNARELQGTASAEINEKVRQRRASPVLVSKADDSPLQPKMAPFSSKSTPKESDAALVSESNVKNQEFGDMVHVSKFNKKEAGLKVDPSKEEILVQLGNMKLKLTL
ncbi:hypothetical protein Tco_0658510, partial [Tanacetum coccineum]